MLFILSYFAAVEAENTRCFARREIRHILDDAAQRYVSRIVVQLNRGTKDISFAQDCEYQLLYYHTPPLSLSLSVQDF